MTTHRKKGGLSEMRIKMIDPELVKEIRDQAFEEVLKRILEWTKSGVLRLRAGEMSTQESRTVRAVLNQITCDISELKGTVGG